MREANPQLEARMQQVEARVRENDAVRAPARAAARRQTFVSAVLLIGAYPAMLTAGWALDAWQYHQLDSLHRAAYDGDAATCEHLIRKGVLVDTPDGDGDTALHWAVYRVRVDVVRTLIAQGANIDREDIYGRTPLSLTKRALRGHLLQGTATERDVIARMLTDR